VCVQWLPCVAVAIHGDPLRSTDTSVHDQQIRRQEFGCMPSLRRTLIIMSIGGRYIYIWLQYDRPKTDIHPQIQLLLQRDAPHVNAYLIMSDKDVCCVSIDLMYFDRKDAVVLLERDYLQTKGGSVSHLATGQVTT
jgi:hypothetical protein